MERSEIIIKEINYGDLFLKLICTETTISSMGSFDTSISYDTTYSYDVIMRYDKDKENYYETFERLSEALIAFDKLNELLRRNNK